MPFLQRKCVFVIVAEIDIVHCLFLFVADKGNFLQRRVTGDVIPMVLGKERVTAESTILMFLR